MTQKNKSGNAPFGGPDLMINKLTTRIQMIRNGGKVGVPFSPRTHEEEEFAEGVLEAEELASNPSQFLEK